MHPTSLLARLTHQQRSLLLLVFLVLSLNALIGAYLFGQQQQSQRDEHSRHYGTALAQLAARQAVDATLNNDLVSLQVILKDVAQNPRVAGATIHDVENQLLVQGGHLPSGSHLDQRSFSAPITLHNAIAGYVTVTLDMEETGNNALYAPLFWSWAALLALSIAVVAVRRESNTNSADADDADDADSQPRTEEIPPAPAIEVASTPPAVPRPQVILQLKIHNFHPLHSQLNRGSFKSLINRFEQQLQGVQALYGGKLKQSRAGDASLMLTYSGDKRDDCCFRATCSAQLLLGLAAQVQGAQLQLSALLTAPANTDEDTPLWEQLLASGQSPLQPPPQQVYIAQTLLSASLERQAAYTTLAQEQGARLEAIKPPYSELLAKQQQQLLAL